MHVRMNNYWKEIKKPDALLARNIFKKPLVFPETHKVQHQKSTYKLRQRHFTSNINLNRFLNQNTANITPTRFKPRAQHAILRL